MNMRLKPDARNSSGSPLVAPRTGAKQRPLTPIRRGGLDTPTGAVQRPLIAGADCRLRDARGDLGASPASPVSSQAASQRHAPAPPACRPALRQAPPCVPRAPSDPLCTMLKGWFDAFRTEGGPTLYAASNRTAVTEDIRNIIIYVSFSTLFLAFLIVFPGIRKEGKAFSAVPVGPVPGAASPAGRAAFDLPAAPAHSRAEATPGPVGLTLDLAAGGTLIASRPSVRVPSRRDLAPSAGLDSLPAPEAERSAHPLTDLAHSHAVRDAETGLGQTRASGCSTPGLKNCHQRSESGARVMIATLGGVLGSGGKRPSEAIPGGRFPASGAKASGQRPRPAAVGQPWHRGGRCGGRRGRTGAADVGTQWPRGPRPAGVLVAAPSARTPPLVLARLRPPPMHTEPRVIGERRRQGPPILSLYIHPSSVASAVVCCRPNGSHNGRRSHDTPFLRVAGLAIGKTMALLQPL
ncbi:hypothetical protein IscW_ISCW000990 [Ixodes scapularis]|uniref:Uncharacterized protein n=1 Tax=Ixodes scapularis TaxID=6945 RepID=B7P2X3_IXOSC|nr:hypothetical protein IscW_ISCW000990 [Ixodes scapularis]|eukprot:XP_002403097.1 hypothetical protein IscW_ISCW000990 [Ixodes scapularis]